MRHGQKERERERESVAHTKSKHTFPKPAVLDGGELPSTPARLFLIAVPLACSDGKHTNLM